MAQEKKTAIINKAVYLVNKKSGKDKRTGSSYEKAIRWEISRICNEQSFYM